MATLLYLQYAVRLLVKRSAMKKQTLLELLAARRKDCELLILLWLLMNRKAQIEVAIEKHLIGEIKFY